MNRRPIIDFQLANSVYAGAEVAFYEVDANGTKTATLATLFDGPTGAGTLANPVTLDSQGKFTVIPYIETAVKGVVSSALVSSHETGLIQAFGNNRGEWQTGVIYYPGDWMIAGGDADGSNDFMVANTTHLSGDFADDKSDGKVGVAIDVSFLAGLFSTPDPSGNPLSILRVNAAGNAYELVSLTTAGALRAGQNLNDLSDKAAARTNLGYLAAVGEFTKNQYFKQRSVSSNAGVLTIDWSDGPVAFCLLTEHITTVNFNNIPNGGLYEIIFKQPDTGTPFTVTGWPTVKGSVTTVSATLGAYDYFSFKAVNGVLLPFITKGFL